MSDVKRWWTTNVATNDDALVVYAADHDRVVEELKNEALLERLTINNTLNEVIDAKNRTIAELIAALKQVEPALADNQFSYDYEGKEYNNADIIEALDIVRKALGKGSKS